MLQKTAYAAMCLGLLLLTGILAHFAHAGGGRIAPQGGAPLGHARNVYSSTNVTTSAYVELVHATPGVAANTLEIYDSSTQTLVLAYGVAGSEVDELLIPPGGNGVIRAQVPPSTRLSIKAVSASATTGEIDLNILQ